MSCGGCPIETKGYNLQSLPMLVNPDKFTWATNSTLFPSRTSGPTMQKGPIETPSAIVAFLSTYDEGCTYELICYSFQLQKKLK